MPTSYTQIIRSLTHDVVRYKSVTVILFVLINLVAVAIGLAWPKSYTSSSTIFVEEKNIIQPLMQGAAVATDVRDRATVAKELLFGRKIILQVLDQAGWFTDKTTDLDKDGLIEEVKTHTKVLNVGRNLIKIESTAPNPEQAFKTTQKFAELFVQESSSTARSRYITTS
jgi:protein tyrosine kinase modulator